MTTVQALHRHNPYAPRPRPTKIDKHLLLEAIFETNDRLHYDACSVEVDEPDCPDPLVIATEHEREHTILLSRLIHLLETTGTPETAGAIRYGVRQWLDTRPVPDKVAAERGLAILEWTGAHTEARWHVVVPRETGPVSNWVPTVHTSSEMVNLTRANAIGRSRALTVTPISVGDVTMWAYMINPALSTAVLLQPELVCDGRPIEDMYAAVTPRRPVAVAPLAPTQRLVEASTENHVLIPLTDLESIDWN